MKHKTGFCTLTISGWNLATARAAHPELEDAPMAIVSGGRVLEASPLASEMGVTSGMTPREAHSRLPSLALVEFDEDLARRAFTPVVQAIFEVTPFVQLERPGRLHFPLEGVIRYYGSAELLAEKILESLPSSAVLRVQGDTIPALGVGIASSRFVSLLAAIKAAELARSSPSSKGSAVGLGSPPAGWIALDPETHPAAFVAGFSVDVLRHVLDPDDPHDMEVWRLLGISTLGDLASLDPAPLADRFGKWAVKAWYLANGRDPDNPDPAIPPRRFEISHEFDPPVSRIDRLLFAAREIGAALEETLSAEALTCRYLRLEVSEQSGRTTSVSWRVEDSVALAAQRCRWHLELLTISSPVTALRLIPQDIVPQRGKQLCLEGLALDARYAGKEWEDAKLSLARAEAILGDQIAYFIETCSPDRGACDAARGHLPHEDARLVALSLLDPSPKKPSATTKTRRNFDGGTSIEQRRLPAPSPFLEVPPLPGSLPPPYPASVLQVEIIRDGGYARRASATSVPYLLTKPARVTTLECTKQPVLVRRGPRPTDPPESVDGSPVISAAGPWSYLLRWWDEEHSFTGEMWQVVLEDSGDRSARLIFRSDDGLWYLYGIYD